MIPIERIDAFVYDESPLPETTIPASSEIEVAIGKECAVLIPDGACIQMGIGSQTLRNAHRDVLQRTNGTDEGWCWTGRRSR